MPTIERAAGHPNWIGKLIPEHVYAPLLDNRIYAATCLPQITTSKYKQEEAMAVKNIGAKVHVQRRAKIHMQKYVKGGEIEIDPSIGESFELTINRAQTWNKFHDLIDLTSSPHKNLTSAEISDAADEQAVTMETECFSEWASFPDSHNVGNSAGYKSGQLVLGTIDHPVVLTKENSVPYFMQFGTLFEQYDLSDKNGALSIIMPPTSSLVFRQAAPVIDASQSGGKSSLKTRQIRKDYEGIGDLYSSTLLPSPRQGVYPVLALRADGLAFFAKNLQTRVNRELEKTFGTLTSGVFVYDWNVIRPEAIAIGYVKLSLPTITVDNG